MLFKRFGGIVVACVLLPVTAMAADANGSLLYDGQPVAPVFPDITAGRVEANPWSGGDLIQGTVDLATSTYSISGLGAEKYSINVYLERTAPASQFWNAGDLVAATNVEPEDTGSSITQDLDVKYIYRTLSPVDSTGALDGSGLDCTAYPTAAYPITVTLEPVPRATAYSFAANLYSCPSAYLDALRVDSAQPSAQIEWGTAGEDYQNIYVLCTGASGKELCTGPTFVYNDSGVWALLLRNGSAAGRGAHHSNAVFIPAVASLPGVSPTYWTSAVSVASLSSVERQIEVTYTPRGKDGTVEYTTKTISVPALSVISWSDIVSELFAASGAGSLEIRGSDLVVMSRTSTPGAGGGTYGQGVPPLQPEDLLSGGGAPTAVMAGVEEGTAFRTNLGLCEVWGEGATVKVTVRDASGIELGNTSYQLRPYEFIQIDRLAVKVAGTSHLSDGMVEVTVVSGNGRVGAYLSVIDNSTGDPTYIAVAPQSTIGS